MNYRHQSKRVIVMRIVGMLIVLGLTWSDEVLVQDCQANVSSKLEPQCAHYCVHSCCKLLGAPLQLKDIVELMPSKPTGESLWDIKEVLEKIGFKTESKWFDRKSLLSVNNPIVAFVNNNHFVVIEDTTENVVRLLDGLGRRNHKALEDFGKSWTGLGVIVKKPHGSVALPAFYKPASDQPCLQFDTLYVDVGDVPKGQKVIEFEFPFVNLGGSDLKIHSVKAKCSCTSVINTPTDFISPGEKSKITIQYKVADKQSSFSHTVLVKSNDSRFPLMPLTIAANSRQKLYIKPNFIIFPDVEINESSVSGCVIRYTGDKYLEIKGYTTDIEGLSVSWKRLDQDLISKLIPDAIRIDRQHAYLIKASVNGDLVNTNRRDGQIVFQTNINEYPDIIVPVVLKRR